MQSQVSKPKGSAYGISWWEQSPVKWGPGASLRRMIVHDRIRLIDYMMRLLSINGDAPVL